MLLIIFSCFVSTTSLFAQKNDNQFFEKPLYQAIAVTGKLVNKNINPFTRVTAKMNSGRACLIIEAGNFFIANQIGYAVSVFVQIGFASNQTDAGTSKLFFVANLPIYVWGSWVNTEQEKLL